MLRSGLPLVRVHKLVIQYQMARPEDLHASNTTQSRQVVFGNIHEYMYYVFIQL